MIRWLIALSLVVFAIIVSVIVVYDYDSGNERVRKKTGVAMIMRGVRNDHSWNEAHYEALEKVARRLNLEVTVYDNIPADSTAYNSIEKAVANGAEIVIANSFDFGAAAMSVAKKHPKVKFLHAAGVRTETNLLTYFGRIYQMRYLSGIVAGLKTKTNEIGYVAAFRIPEVVRGLDAFTLGVQKVNPQAKVFVSWSHSWSDESMAAEATHSLLKKHHIDVLTVHLDALSPYEIADEKGVWIVGYNMDNSSRFPNHFLTAPVWRWENFYEARIRDIMSDNFIPEKYWLGVESGVVDLAPLTEHVGEDIAKVVAHEKEMLAQNRYDVFWGPIVDSHGNVRVEKGECIPDEDLLEHFDWYVKGVYDGTKSQKY